MEPSSHFFAPNVNVKDLEYDKILQNSGELVLQCSELQYCDKEIEQGAVKKKNTNKILEFHHENSKIKAIFSEYGYYESFSIFFEASTVYYY